FAMELAAKPGSPTDPIELSAVPDFELGGLHVHPSTREAIRGGVRHIVEPRVMQVLVALVHARGAVVSRDELIRCCWKGRVVGEAAINGCISKLRALAEADGSAPAFNIATIPRVGYRLQPADGFGAAPSPDVPPELPVDGSPATPAHGHRWTLASGLAAIVLAIALGGFLAWHRHRPVAEVDAAKPSIAVLPFKNLSAEADAGFLAEAIQDEILTRLAKIGSLKVISRTSADEAAKKPGTLAEMANRLGVANILEGSVQRDGDTVRVNVQLIRAATDDHLWAENYDRRLDDVLSVESDIAGSVATALAARITPVESVALAAKPTTNAKAYELYLRAIVLSRTGYRVGVDARVDEAIAALKQAVAIDPEFALAWAMLTRLQANSYFGDRDPAERESTHHALDRARALAPDAAEVQLADAQYKHYVELDYDGAKRKLEALHGRWPGNVEILQSLALVSRRLGHWREAAAYFTQAQALDPLSYDNLGYTAWTLYYGHRPTEAGTVIAHMREIWPDDPWIIVCEIDVLQSLGDLDRADEAITRLPSATDRSGDTILLRRAQYAYRRHFAEGLAWFETLGASSPVQDWKPSQRAMLALSIGDFRRWTGDMAGARQSYQAAADALRNSTENDLDVLRLSAYAYSGLGERQAALRYMEQLTASPLAADPINSAPGKTCIAQVFARLGDRDATIAALERAMSEPSDMTSAVLRLEPDFDALRNGDPRFDRLMAEGARPLD
ncbi:MAG TPA: winged helix-turn-helix domain-containing protein, partial [Rhodanobacteraceae bacterium]|nr:winged helix-turn-helix domain-containing protein [Rhodanobacteraceae bacterium]